jgi:hypothetical protein
VIAAELRVSGPPGLASRGQAAQCRLDDGQLAALDAALQAGPQAAGWGADLLFLTPQ